MNIRDLEYIIAVDELKSFIKASVRCYVSQPALSMQIKKVEDALGIKIFERTRKSIITTAEGKKFLDYAKEILRNFDVIKSIKNDSSQIRVGIIQTVSSYLLPKVITRMQKELSDVKMFFTEGKTKELMMALANGELDAIVFAADCKQSIRGYSTNSKMAQPTNLELKVLYKEEFLLCFPEGHKLSSFNGKITKEGLKKVLDFETLILLEEGNCMTDSLNSICSHYNTNPIKTHSDFYATSIETIKHMVKLGNGISILPKLSTLEGVNGLQFAKMPEEDSRTISLAYRKNTSKFDILNSIEAIIQKTLFLSLKSE